MIVELFIPEQPFQESYKRYKSGRNIFWVKSPWKKLDHCGITVEINNIKFTLPQGYDFFLII